MDNVIHKNILKTYLPTLLPFLISHDVSFRSALEDVYQYISKPNSNSKAEFVKVHSLQPRYNNCSNDDLYANECEMNKFRKSMPELAEARKAIRPGDGFQPFEKIQKLFVENKQVSLEHQEGEVLLIIFWIKKYFL